MLSLPHVTQFECATVFIHRINNTFIHGLWCSYLKPCVEISEAEGNTMADSNETCATAKEERKEELAMEQGTYEQAILI